MTGTQITGDPLGKSQLQRILGERRTIETVISEEALLFAKYLRNDIKTWKPRIAS